MLWFYVIKILLSFSLFASRFYYISPKYIKKPTFPKDNVDTSFKKCLCLIYLLRLEIKFTLEVGTERRCTCDRQKRQKHKNCNHAALLMCKQIGHSIAFECRCSKLKWSRWPLTLDYADWINAENDQDAIFHLTQTLTQIPFRTHRRDSYAFNGSTLQVNWTERLFVNRLIQYQGFF